MEAAATSQVSRPAPLINELTHPRGVICSPSLPPP
jgi:hypothetical protein